jgi:thioredoxin 1
MVVEIQDMNTLKTGNYLVDFYTHSCAPCRAMQPFLEEISNEFSGEGVTVAKVEVTKNPSASQLYGVMSVPTLMVMKDSKIKEVSMGFKNKAMIKALLEKHVRARKN